MRGARVPRLLLIFLLTFLSSQAGRGQPTRTACGERPGDDCPASPTGGDDRVSSLWEDDPRFKEFMKKGLAAEGVDLSELDPVPSLGTPCADYFTSGKFLRWYESGLPHAATFLKLVKYQQPDPSPDVALQDCVALRNHVCELKADIDERCASMLASANGRGIPLEYCSDNRAAFLGQSSIGEDIGRGSSGSDVSQAVECEATFCHQSVRQECVLFCGNRYTGCVARRGLSAECSNSYETCSAGCGPRTAECIRSHLR